MRESARNARFEIKGIVKFCALLHGDVLTVFDTAEARMKYICVLPEQGPRYRCLDLEIDIVERAFARERMIALVAAARALKKTELRGEAAHYLRCARAERQRMLRAGT